LGESVVCRESGLDQLLENMGKQNDLKRDSPVYPSVKQQSKMITCDEIRIIDMIRKMSKLNEQEVQTSTCTCTVQYVLFCELTGYDKGLNIEAVGTHDQVTEYITSQYGGDIIDDNIEEEDRLIAQMFEDDGDSVGIRENVLWIEQVPHDKPYVHITGLLHGRSAEWSVKWCATEKIRDKERNVRVFHITERNWTLINTKRHR
jgi:hypothetical protein